MNANDTKKTGSVQVDVQIPVKQPSTIVWRSLFEQTALWWPADYYATSHPSCMVFEPTLGGQLYEEAESGAAVLWYTVIAIEPPLSINLAGHIAPPFGGPATSLLRIDLESASETSSLIRISDSVFGCIDTSTQQRISEGWATIFTSAKMFIEAN